MEQERGRQQGKDGAGVWPPTLTASPLVQSPAARDESREDKTTIKCETSPPSSPRTLRLEKLGHPALSQEDGRSSLEDQASNPSSSQDSLHKGSKRKGIKSSIGRLFGKKEKGRFNQLSREGSTGQGP
ncbi:hypothetical protein EK904_014500 [Melospiza melodia maxima]|nr:hypothetical protein EK904_014500 [Melospiza melodia maxima]